VSRLVGLAAGFAFGALLAAARMNEYDRIHEMLLLRSAEFYLVFATAAPVAMAGLWLLKHFGWRTPFGGALALNRYAVSRKDVTGAAVFGTGWALVGACPGTALAMLGGGGLAAAMVVAGIFCGMALRDLAAARREVSMSAPAPAATGGGS
jgi:hypothetical protein